MVGDAAARIGLSGGGGGLGFLSPRGGRGARGGEGDDGHNTSYGGGGVVTSAAAAAVAAAVSGRERDKALYARALAASSALGLSATRGKGGGGVATRGAIPANGSDDESTSSGDEDGEMTLRLKSRREAMTAGQLQQRSGVGGIGSRGGVGGLTAGPTPTVSRSALRTLAAGLSTGGK
jgi:hypothetical protein